MPGVSQTQIIRELEKELSATRTELAASCARQQEHEIAQNGHIRDIGSALQSLGAQFEQATATAQHTSNILDVLTGHMDRMSKNIETIQYDWKDYIANRSKSCPTREVVMAELDKLTTALLERIKSSDAEAGFALQEHIATEEHRVQAQINNNHWSTIKVVSAILGIVSLVVGITTGAIAVISSAVK